MTDTQAQILIKHLRCEHKVSRGGNDYLSCDDCGFEWDYRKIASGKEAAETKFLLALAAERDAERERTAKMLEEIAEEHHVAHQDKFKSEWQRETEWNKYIRYKEAAELVRSRVAAKGEG